ncbi:MAG: dockerin type I repeat-containing protein [Prevotella sp.]|nr:dockerin type I repeat-containing protein [Prevotella sp.]
MKKACLYLAFMLVSLYVEGNCFKAAGHFLGDVNLDDKIDVTDVMCIVDYVLSKQLRVFAAYNADVNDDGTIDVTDAMVIVDYLLGKPTSTVSASDNLSTDEVYVKSYSSDF